MFITAPINVYNYWDRARARVLHFLVDIKCFTHCLLYCLKKTKHFVNKTIYFPERLHNQVKPLTAVKKRKKEKSQFNLIFIASYSFAYLLSAIVTEDKERVQSLSLHWHHARWDFSVSTLPSLCFCPQRDSLMGTININIHFYFKMAY